MADKTITLKYDSSQSVKSFQLLASAAVDLEQKIGDLPPELKAITEKLKATESAMVTTSEATYKLADAQEELTETTEKSAESVIHLDDGLEKIRERQQAAADAMREVSASTDTASQSFHGAAESAEGFGSAIDIVKYAGLATLADELQDVAGGLERFAKNAKKTTADTGSLGSQFSTLGPLAAKLASTITALAIPVSTIAAILYSARTLWKEYSEDIEQVADKSSTLDGTLLGLAHSIGLIDEATLNTSETLKKEGETLDRLTEQYKANEKAAADKAIAEQQLNDEAAKTIERQLEATRAAAAQAESMKNITSPEEADRQIRQLLTDLQALANVGKADAETRQRYAASVNQLEARRIELVVEARAKEAAAEEEKKAKQEEFFRRNKELRDKEEAEKKAQEDRDHQERMRRVEELAKAKAEQARKDREDKLKEYSDIIKSGDEAVEQIERVQQAAEGPQEAVRGADSNPYAAALDPLATALGSGFGETIGEQTGGGGTGRGGGGRGDLIREVAKQIEADRIGVGKDEAQRMARGIVTEDMRDGSINNEQVVEAQQRVLDEQIRAAGKRAKADEEQISLAQEMARNMVQLAAADEQKQREIAAIREILKGAFGGGMPVGRGARRIQ